MTRSEREAVERQAEQTRLNTEALNRLAAAFERVADAQEAQAKVADPSFRVQP